MMFNGVILPQAVKVNVTRYRDGREFYGMTEKVYRTKSNKNLLIIKTNKGFLTFEEGEVNVVFKR